MSAPFSTDDSTPAEGVFHAATELPPGEREAFVAEQCGADDQLHARVRRLLAAHEASDNFMATAMMTPESMADAPEKKPEKADEHIGPYKLLQQIGEGGFGTVWMAEQERPVRRQVALKIIKMGMDTKEVVARFEQERQALAMMEHSHIAQVFDAGVTPFGRPFFVMELVRGVRITTYCDEHDLPMRARIELFIQVCQAVQHAHQKGIIHRDLKPSNVLVTINDGEPVAKVIDFGVAKATQGPLTDSTLCTQFEQMIGTPLYMSPEQAEMTAQDIDTRSDIYSLGVLLYELLTGRTPIDTATMARAGLDEIRRLIREVDPPRPSARVKTLAGEDLTRTAQRRHTDAGKLTGALRGDLDWIVMKCLEKDRNRRYDTANAFTADLRRHLADEPVEAGPPSLFYRLRKLLRRRKGAVAATAGVVLALMAGVVASLWQAVAATKARDEAMTAHSQATKARDEAMTARSQATVARDEARKEAAISKAVNDFINNDLLGAASPRRGPDRDLKMRTVLDRAAAGIGNRFQDQPLVEAEIQSTLAKTYLALGESDKARQHAERNVELRQRALGPEHRQTLQSRNILANVLLAQGKYAEAEAEHRAVRELMERILGSEDPDTLRSRNNLGILLHREGKDAAAEAENRAVLEIQERILGPEHHDTLVSRGNLANALLAQGKRAEAETENRAVLEIRERILGPEHPDTLMIRNNLASSMRDQARYAEAEAEIRAVTKIQERTLGPEHPDTLMSRSNLAGVWYAQARNAEAEAEFRAVFKIQERTLGPEHPEALTMRMNAANALNAQGKSAEAEAEHRAVLKSKERILGPEHPETLRSRINLANALYGEGKYAEAEAEHRAVLGMRERVLGPNHPDTLLSLNNLARSLKAQDKLDEARDFARRAMEGRRKVLGSTHPDTRKSEKLYGDLTSKE